MTSTCILLLAAAACTALPAPDVESPRGRTFVPMVPDSADDVGFGSSIAVDGDGLPYVSYLGFAGELDEGEIPVTRPVGSPYLQTEEGDDAAAVLLSSLSTDQIWNRGAVAQPRETPGGVTVPFGPAAEPSLRSLTPGKAGGTDIEISGSDIHVTWTADTGVWYGAGPNFEVERIEETPEAGSPSIAIGEGGAPVIAYTVAGLRPEVRVAERDGDRWRTTTVMTLSACGEGCPPATRVAIAGGEPLVVVADPASGELIAARPDGATWATEVVATGAVGGISLEATDDGALIGFYTAGGVAVATGRFGEWATQEVAPVEEEPEGPSPAAPAPPVGTEPTTGVAVSGDGTAWITWEDPLGIHLASSAEGGPFEEIELSHADGGANPSVTVTDDGATVYLSWLDTEEADLRVGIYAETEKLLIAAPSPTAAPAVGIGDESCGEDGEPQLEIVARGTAFTPICLVAPVGERFTISFDNQDDTAATGPHDIVIAEDVGSVGSPIFNGEDILGPDSVEYDVPAIEDAGDYFFQCTFHPAVMTGTLAVIEVGGGGGGGGGG